MFIYRFIPTKFHQHTSWFCCDIISEHNPFGWLWLVDDDASNGLADHIHSKNKNESRLAFLLNPCNIYKKLFKFSITATQCLRLEKKFHFDFK